MMKRVVIYIRVSTEEQALHGDSLEAQETALIEYAERMGYKIVKIYRDEGFSARKPVMTRDAMVELLEDAKNKKFDMIIFTKIDRWFRSVGDYHKVQEILDQNKIHWKTILEDYDTSTADGRLKINIMLSVAENEADRTSERIKFVQQNKIKNKEPITGIQPWGYKIDTVDGRKRIVKDEEIAPIIEDMFDHYLTHNSASATAKYLNKKYDLQVSNQKIGRCLVNSVYTGEYKDIVDYRPPYITKETYKKIMTISNAGNVKVSPTRRVYLFSGLLICPECSGKYAGSTKYPYGRNKQGYMNYRCSKYWSYSGQCSNKSIIGENTIEKYLLKNIEQELKDYIFNVEIEREQKKTSPKRDARKYEERLKRLNKMFMLENISEDEYIIESKELKAIIDEIRAETKETNIDLTELKTFLKSDFRSLYDTLNRENKRAFWRSIIKEIYIKDHAVDHIVFK